MSTTQPICFDDTATKQGVCQDIDFICGTTVVTFPKADKVRLVNLGIDAAADFIQKYSDHWVLDDTSLSTSPVAYLDVVANVQTVAIDATYIALRGVYVNDGNENYTELAELSEEEVLTTKYNNTGTPTGFRLIGNKIYLKPIPPATTTGNTGTKLGYGLKIQYEKNLVYFASDATTATIGYNPQFTRLATLYACRDYAMAKSKENLKTIREEIAKLEGRLKDAYARRNKTQKSRLGISNESNK